MVASSIDQCTDRFLLVSRTERLDRILAGSRNLERFTRIAPYPLRDQAIHTESLHCEKDLLVSTFVEFQNQ
jgi:hypothetical protein